MSDVSLGLAHEVEVMLRKVGATRENFWVPVSRDEEVARRLFKIVSVRPSYDVVVNRDITRQQSLEAGKYDWVNSDITQENFPVKGKGEQNIDIVLFHFNRWVSDEEVLTEMDKAGYRPDDIDEHLALGAQYPELQKQFPIACLGSVWRCRGGRGYVPCLSWDGVERGLPLYWLEVVWPAGWRFAAVRKSK